MHWSGFETTAIDLAASSRDRKATNLYHISHADDEKNDPCLESLYYVRAGELKQILFLNLLEHAAFDLDKLVRYEQRQQ
ncbi:hypothetical protein RRF57_011071 [Xylaria bambusicola]|uniref:Uncharacterized protein n=1 Tax=Xylaria bambusicola TaxID=326684 RepID=A0AAN7Z3B3_9PEZI